MNALVLSDPPQRSASPDLWRIAGAFMHTLAMLFGAPADLARAHTLTAKAHALTASWLLCAEAMLRRLLLIEAAAYAIANAPPARAARTRVRRPVLLHADRPEAWRVSFRCFTSSRARGRGARTEKRFYSAWPLALRYEALVRAIADPAPFARRLARRLWSAPARSRGLLAAPEAYPHRIDHAERFTRAAERAALRFNSS